MDEWLEPVTVGRQLDEPTPVEFELLASFWADLRTPNIRKSVSDLKVDLVLVVQKFAPDPLLKLFLLELFGVFLLELNLVHAIEGLGELLGLWLEEALAVEQLAVVLAFEADRAILLDVLVEDSPDTEKAASMIAFQIRWLDHEIVAAGTIFLEAAVRVDSGFPEFLFL